MFRVGRGDEVAPSAGVTHLVEHLALFPFGQRHYEYNGLVDAIATLFVASGTPAEVADHLTSLCRSLADLPLERLEIEERVLRDEAGRRSVGPPDHHSWLRWGLHGPGLAFISEFGLWRLTPADVQDWSTRWFTAGNAAVVWAGPKLPAFELPLPAGERRPPRPLIDLLNEPVWAVGAAAQVTISFSLKRNSAYAAGQRILAKRLQQQLRYERGISYDVSLQYQPLSAELATSTVWATCGAQDAGTVRDVVVGAADALATVGPTSDELAADRDAMRRSMEQPFHGQGEAGRLAIQDLLGAPAETLDQLADELAQVTPEDVRAAFQAIRRTAILTQPSGVAPPSDWFKPYPNLTPEQLPGRRFRNQADSVWSPIRRYPTLVVGDFGVSLAGRDGTGVGIRYRDVALAVRQASGRLTVVHENGTQVDLDPAAWINSNVAIELAAAGIPPDRLVDVEDEPAGSRPSPRSWPGVIVLIYAGIAAFFALSFASVAGIPDPALGVIAPISSLLGFAGSGGLTWYVVAELRRNLRAPLIGAGAFLALQLAAVLFYQGRQSPALLVFLVPPFLYLLGQTRGRRLLGKRGA